MAWALVSTFCDKEFLTYVVTFSRESFNLHSFMTLWWGEELYYSTLVLSRDTWCVVTPPFAPFEVILSGAPWLFLHNPMNIGFGWTKMTGQWGEESDCPALWLISCVCRHPYYLTLSRTRALFLSLYFSLYLSLFATIGDMDGCGTWWLDAVSQRIRETVYR